MPLPSLCFSSRSKNKMTALASDWLRYFRLLLWYRGTEFNDQVCVFRADQKRKMAALASDLLRHFSTSPLKPLNGIQRHLTGSKISMPSTKFVFFRPIGKTKWPPWPLIGQDIFNFSSETADQNSTKFDRKQDLKALYQVCVFRADEWAIVIAHRLSSVCPSSVRRKLFAFSTSSLKPLNRIQRNLSGSKISMPSTKFVFFGSIGKTRWPPWPLIGWDIFDFSSERAEGNSTKLTGSKISTPSTKFVFFEPIGKTRWPPWLLIGWDIFDFSSDTAEQNSTKLVRKQDLNALYQVCVFWVNRKNKMAALASDWLRHFRLLLWNRWREFNETWQEARSQRPLPSLCFSSRSEKTRWPPWPLIGWDIFDFSSDTVEQNSTKLDRKQDLNALYQVCVFQADEWAIVIVHRPSSVRPSSVVPPA